MNMASNILMDKLARLKQQVRDTGGLAIAFSAGVDSTFLVAVAKEELGEGVVAVTALSALHPKNEKEEAACLAERLGVRHVTIASNELNLPGFADNPPNRCYLCKRELLKAVKQIAKQHGFSVVADGSNADDALDYRPGRRAVEEQGVITPLASAGLTKAEIRQLSRDRGLSTAEKPSMACLASRFPYGTRITRERLEAVDSVEAWLRCARFSQFRVRYHGEVARIEIPVDEFSRLCVDPCRSDLLIAARKAGFSYVALDLQGYRTGSMNETLTNEQRGKGENS